MMNARPQLLPLLLATALVACLPAEAIDAPPDETAGVTEELGLVRVRALASRTTGAQQSRIEADAHFIEHTEIDRATVSAALGIWTPTVESGCTVSHPAATIAASASLRLRSAGALGVSGNGAVVRMQPRPLSAAARLSGVVYGTDADDDATFAAGEPYVVWAEGEHIGRFVTRLDAPDPVVLLAIDGQELGSATEVRVDGRAGLTVDLFSEQRPVYVSLRDARSISSPTIECRFDDAAQVAFDWFELDAVFGAGAELELVARTITARPLPAEARFGGLALIEAYDRVVVRR